MKMKTTECAISDLKPEIASFVKSQLLVGEEPLFSWATEILKTGRVHVVVVTKSEIVRLSKRHSEEIDDIKTMYLDKVVSIGARQDTEGESIEVFGHGEYNVITFPFDSKQSLFTFLYQLRKAIYKAKSKLE